jgi:hypothetical protein
MIVSGSHHSHTWTKGSGILEKHSSVSGWLAGQRRYLQSQEQ